MAGLKLVEAINRRAGRLTIHGVNLGLALHHDVEPTMLAATPPSVTRAETLSTLESWWLPPQAIPDLTFEV